MLKMKMTKTASLFLAAVLMPYASMAIEDCGTSVTECQLRQEIKELRQQNKTLQGQMEKIQAAMSLMQQEMAVINGCPAGMANAGGYCIHTISPYPRGKNWWQALDACIADGYRLCSQSEVVNALRAGVIKQYYWSEGDSWYVTASQAETSPGAGGENQVCEVQGNINQADHPQYSIQCQGEKSWTDKWRTTVCCY